MRNKLTKIVFTAVIALLLPLMSCDFGGSSALVGRWLCVSGEEKGVIAELLSDGTGIVTKGSVGVAITWKTEKGRFYSTAAGFAEAENYELQGSLLTFTKDNGKVNEYMKCKNDCEEVPKEYVKAKLAKAKKGSGSFTDSRDGKSYKTVKLDNQTWMAENLNYEVESSKCYDNKYVNCQKYGRLYNWATAKKACPNGWHLPSNKEWQTLVNLAGGEEIAGSMLKSSSDWKDNGNGVDAVGFSALPGGSDDFSEGFNSVGEVSVWWSTLENNASRVYVWYIGYEDGSMSRLDDDKTSLNSVRCVQD